MACCQALGMWHSMHPLAGSTGQVVLTLLGDVFCCEGFVRDGGAESDVSAVLAGTGSGP